MTAISKAKHNHLTSYVSNLVREAQLETEGRSLLQQVSNLENIYKNYCEQITGIQLLVRKYEFLQKKVKAHARVINEFRKIK